MRFEELVLVAFGPFTNWRVRLAPGMTLIFGKNEAGKSTIHAALYAALCGVRTSRGAPRREDQTFASRHKPWNGTVWQVSALVALDDGRRIDLRQSLDGGSKSEAIDQSGRDVATEIMNEGNPDAAKWVGLDRRSFQATACVAQTEVLEVLEDAQLLQTHLQRAAASAGKDETAARALDRIVSFDREHVGPDKQNSVKPLNRAKQRHIAAQQSRQKALDDRHRLTDMLTAVETAATTSKDLGQQLTSMDAQVARAEADDFHRRLRRAHELSERLPNGPPPPVGRDDELANAALGAIQAWNNRPKLPELTGPDSEALVRQLQALPALPTGDLEPDESVLKAKAVYDRTILAMDSHDALRLSEGLPSIPAIDEGELRALAEVLDRPNTAVDEGINRELTSKRHDLKRAAQSRTWRAFALVAGAFMLAAGIAGVVTGLVPAGVALATLGAIVMVWSRFGANNANEGSVLEAIRALEEDLSTQQHAVSGAAEARRSAQDRARQFNLPDRPGELRQMADVVRQANRARDELARWSVRRSELEMARNEAEGLLRETLRERGADPLGDVESAFSSYVETCRSRRQIAAQAASRVGLQERLAFRKQAEEALRMATELISNAEQRLIGAATACSLSADNAGMAYDLLKEWLDQRKGVLAKRDVAQQEWTELETLLDGRSLTELTAATEQRESAARRFEALLRGATGVKAAPDASRRTRIRAEFGDASDQARRLLAEAEAFERSLVPLAEIEEELAAAEAQLRRLEKLGETLALAREFLEQAQDRVHLTVAPLLQQTLNQWLPLVTGGRYVDSMVDPKTLTVRIRSSEGAHWRDAQLLSHGTAEQTYLLLRMAMTQHLTRGRESCPMILDDVVVQSDSDRTAALLRLLHEISSTRQIVLLTVSELAATWAEQHLQGSRDRFERLDHSKVPT